MGEQIINNSAIRQNNLRTLFLAVYKYGPVSKRELQKITSLSWGSVSTMVEELERLNYIVPAGKITGNVGRKAAKYAVDAGKHHILGIDLNASGISGVAADLRGKIIRQVFRPLTLLTYAKVIETLFEIVDSLAGGEGGESHLLGIGIAAQGIVDPARGISVFFPQVSGWSNVRLAELCEERYGVKTYIMHDPDCIMIAEKKFGIIKERGGINVALARLDRGIGLALSVDNALSTFNHTSELGHICVNYNGPRCVCGNYGCLENYASIDGMLRRYYEITGAAFDPGIDFKALSLMALEGDRVCRSLFSDMSRYLGVAFSTLANILPIDLIILYGSMIYIRELFDAQMNEFLQKHLFGGRNVEVAYSGLELNAPALGAAVWVSDKVVSELSFTSNK